MLGQNSKRSKNFIPKRAPLDLHIVFLYAFSWTHLLPNHGSIQDYYPRYLFLLNQLVPG